MAEVYFARDSVLGRKVALKLIFVGANSPAAAIDSFTQEARVLAQFNHPNILRERPGCYFKLGCALPGVDRPHHSPLFDLDERALTIGVQLAIAILEGRSKPG